MRHDQAASAITVLSSRRSSVQVIVVVRHKSLVVVAVDVVCVVVRLGPGRYCAWALAHPRVSSTGWRDRPKCNESDNCLPASTSWHDGPRCNEG